MTKIKLYYLIPFSILILVCIFIFATNIQDSVIIIVPKDCYFCNEDAELFKELTQDLNDFNPKVEIIEDYDKKFEVYPAYIIKSDYEDLNYLFEFRDGKYVLDNKDNYLKAFTESNYSIIPRYFSGENMPLTIVIDPIETMSVMAYLQNNFDANYVLVFNSPKSKVISNAIICSNNFDEYLSNIMSQNKKMYEYYLSMDKNSRAGAEDMLFEKFFSKDILFSFENNNPMFEECYNNLESVSYLNENKSKMQERFLIYSYPSIIKGSEVVPHYMDLNTFESFVLYER